MHRWSIVVLRSMLLAALLTGMVSKPQLAQAASGTQNIGGISATVKESFSRASDKLPVSKALAQVESNESSASNPNGGELLTAAAPGPDPAKGGFTIGSMKKLSSSNSALKIAEELQLLGYTLPSYAPSRTVGGLTITPITAYNLIVDSNVLSPSSYGPSAATLGAQYCNTTGATMTNVWAYTGNFNGDNDGTLDEAGDYQAGVYPIRDENAGSYDPAAFAAAYGAATTNPLVGKTSSDYGGSNTFALKFEGGSLGTSDASRYIGTLAAGECRTEYWLVSYPRKARTSTATSDWVTVTGGVKPEDDLWLPYFFWGTSSTTGATPSYVWRPVTMRNEISAMANKIWPNGDNKVPPEYIAAIQQVTGWSTWTPSGSGVAYPGQVATSQGIWYDFGVVGAGFDNNGDFAPDRNAWVQPVGDAGTYDAGCFRLIKTYGLVIVKLNDGTEMLIPFVDRMYFENVPDNNTGAVGLVFYQYAALDGACTAGLTPYQEVASGYDNEKFNGDFGAGVPPMQSQETNMTVDKTGPASVGTSSTVNYTVRFALPESSSTTLYLSVGDPSTSMPLVFEETIPSGMAFVSPVSPTVTMTNYSPATLTASLLYSTNSGATWSATAPANDTLSSAPNNLIKIQWWLPVAIQQKTQGGGTVYGSVSFSATSPTAANPPPMVTNTACLKMGNGPSFTCDDATTLITGAFSISGTVFCDDGTQTSSSGPCSAGTAASVLANGNLDAGGGEPGMPNVSLNLFYDSNGNGSLDSADTLFKTMSTYSSSGTYTVTNGVINSAPAALNGITVIGGKLDLDNSGMIDAADVGNFAGYSVVAGSLDLNNDGVINASDAGSLVLSLGSYDFRFLSAGTYFTQVVKTDGDIQATYGLTTPESRKATIVAANVTGLDYGFAPPLSIEKSVDKTTGIGGNTFTYTITLNNNLPGSGQPGNACVYRVWAGQFNQSGGTPPGGGPANAQWQNAGNSTGRPDGQYASTVMADTSDELGLTRFNTADMGGNITSVGYRIVVNELLRFDDDSMIVDIYDNATVRETDTYTVVGSGTGIETFTGPTGKQYIIDGTITWVPTGGWKFSDFSSAVNRFGIRIVGNRNGGTAGDLALDAASFTITTDQTCSGADSTLDPAPLTDVFRNDHFTLVSTNPPYNSTSVSGTDTTISWNNVGPIYPGGYKQVTVSLRSNDIATTSLDTATSANAKFANGTNANSPVSDTVTVTITDNTDPRSLAGRVFDDNGTSGWTGTAWAAPGGNTGVDGADVGIQGALVTLYQCVLTATGVPVTNVGANRTCAEESGEWRPVQTAYTNASGDYSFPNLVRGYYYVQVDASMVAGSQTADVNQTGVCTTCDSRSNDPNNTTNEELEDPAFVGDLDDNTALTTINFGYNIPSGTFDLGDTLYYDWDGDGIQDANEEGVSGVTVQLLRPDGSVIATQTTSATGGYLFAGLSAAVYTVRVVDSSLPAYVTQTGDPDQPATTCSVCDNASTISLAAENLTRDFGYKPYGSAVLGDTVFRDMDGNGVQSGVRETGISNITVNLLTDMDGNGAWVTAKTTTTNSSGKYQFTNLPDGTYRIQVDTADIDLPKDSFGVNYIPTNGSLYTAITIAGGVVTSMTNPTSGITSTTANGFGDALENDPLNLDADFGFAPLASIGDTVYWDSNANGTQDFTEPGINGVTVRLYTFTDLPDGRYTAGESFTDTNSNGRWDSGEPFVDTLGNGRYDPGEALSGSPVGTTVTATINGQDGKYFFSGLDTDKNGVGYVIVVDTTSAPIASSRLNADPNADGVPTNCAAINPSDPNCDARDGMKLYPGSNYTGADFGFLPLGAFGDQLWIDTNNDGIVNNGETGIPNITVTAVTGNNVTVNGVNYPSGTTLTTSTDANGNYTFQNITAIGSLATWTVTVNTADPDFPASLTQTYDPDGTLSNSTTVIVEITGVVTGVGGCFTLPNGCDGDTDALNLDADFGYDYAGNGALSGTVCLDSGYTTAAANTATDNVGVCGVDRVDANGIGAGEAAYDNVTVYLYRWTDADSDNVIDAGETTQIAATATDANGDYSFTGIPDIGGVYYLVAIGAPQSNMELTTQTGDSLTVGDNARERVVESDPTVGGVDYADASAYEVVLVPAGSTVTNVDFAFAPMGNFDYGDLPSTYSTLLNDAPVGPSHTVPATPNLYLGATPPDAETNGSPTANATGDGADEDGVSLVGVWGNGSYNAVNGTGGAVGVTVNGSGVLIGWIDFNRDGDFTDSGEMIVHQAVAAGTANYTFGIPADTFAGPGDPADLTLYARFRLFESEPLFPSLAYTGSASNGEVEDYAFHWAMTVDKDTTTPNVSPTGTVTYTVALVNTGNATLSSVQAADILPDFNGAAAGKGYTVTNVTATGGLTVNFPGFDGDTNTNLLAAGNSLAAGASRTITITLTLSDAATGTYDNTVFASSTQTGTIDDDGTAAQDADTPSGSDPESDEDVTVGSTGSVVIVKNTVPDEAQDFAYTVTGTGLTPFTLDDDADAALSNTQTFNNLAAGGTYTVTETAVTGWSVTNISCAGATSSTVTIGAAGGFDAGDTAVSVLLAGGETVTCTFENTAILSVVTTKTASDTSIPETGQSVTYIVEVQNTSPVEVILDSLTDDLFNDLTTTGHDNVTATTCATGSPIAAGATYTCAFAATVSGTFPGTHVNTVTAQVRNGSNTASDDDDETVTFEDALPELTVVKSSSAGGTVQPGDAITYTVTITNTGNVPQNNIVVSDAQPAGTAYVSFSSLATGYIIGTARTYLDQFGAAQFNNSNGTAAWGGTPWTETGDNGIANSGMIQINTSTAGAADFQATAPTDVLTLTRPVNLTNAASATLTYSIAENGVNSAADTALVQVWNGAAWTTVATYTGDFTSATGNVNILAYANADTQIRFVVTGFDGGTQNLVLDNVQVQFTSAAATAKDNDPFGGVPGSLINGSPPTLLFSGDSFDLLPSQSMTVSYQATVNNPVPVGQTQVVNTASVTSNEIVTPVQATVTDNILTIPLTLRKTWTNAILNDAVNVTAAVGGTTIDTLSSTANTANETDTDATPVNVTAGQVVTFGETFTTGSAANYTSSVTCTGATDTNLADGLTVNAADTAIVCTETNTRRTATLTLQKTWVGAVTGDTATVNLSGTNNDSLNSTANSANETDADATPTTVYAGETITMSETLDAGNTGSYTGTLACTGATDTNLADGLTVDPADTNIVCTETNTRQTATLTLQKTVVNNNGGTALASAWTLTATGPTTISGTNGQAAVTNAAVPTGTYTLSESGGPAGYTASAWTCTNGVTVTGGQITLALGQTTVCSITNDDNAQATIGNYVWNDIDADGVQDGGETGIAGVTVNLLDNAGNPVDSDPTTPGVQPTTTVTNASGNYSFVVTPGSYIVEFGTLAGYVRSPQDQGVDDALDSDASVLTGRTAIVTVAAGAIDNTLDAGLYQLRSISGQVRYDADNDGNLIDAESGLAGANVTLWTDPNGDGDPSDGVQVGSTVTTTGTGNYSFLNLIPGNYVVVETNPTGYTSTADSADPNNDRIPVVITNADSIGNDFLDTILFTVSGQVRYDADNDGNLADPDSGLAGAGVALYTDPNGDGDPADGTQVGATITTTATGNYSFPNLIPGNYVVVETNPAGYTSTADSADPNNDRIPVVITNADSTGNDFLDANPATIGDFVWYDDDGDGVQDAGETGVSGITVYVDIDGSGTLNAGDLSAVTDGAGAYSITNIPPGTYNVRVNNPPAGATLTGGSNPTNTTLSAGEVDNTIDFGYYRPAVISNYVWLDDDGDGAQDAGESGIANVTVHLLDGSGNPVLDSFGNPITDVTDLNGNYSFTMPAGTYRVDFDLPLGYIFTWANQGNDASDSDADRTTGETANYTLTPGETNNTIDAGMVQPAAIGDFVWNDLDADGVQDAGENGIDGVTVQLYTSGGVLSGITTTAGGGAYLFANVIPGTYYVNFTLPGGYVFTTQDSASATDATDSDADPSTGNTAATTLIPLEDDRSWDAGMYLPVDLRVTKTDGVGTYIPGGSLTYMIQVWNAGPSDAVNANFTDNRPANISSWSWTCAATGSASCGATTNGTGNISLSDIDLPADAGGATDYLTFTVNATVSGSASGALTNTATVTAPSGVRETNTANNTVTDTDTPADATLTLQKTVVNDNGGTAVETAWTLTATGPTTVSGTNGQAAITNAAVLAGTYTLSESGGPAGYTAGTWSCTNSVTVTGGQITLTSGQGTTCTITNDDTAPSLTLQKVVTNDNGGTALASAWTLTANGTGANDVSGAGPSVSSGATLQADTFTLSESGGPAGYTASAWTCTNGVTVTGSQITLGIGQTTVCSITNDDTDLLPQAVPDTNTAVENGPAVGGNVLTNETSLGNTPTTVTAASQGASTITIGTAFPTAAGGSLTLNADGTYSYTPPAWNLVPPAGLVEVFNYTIRDVDGDLSSTTLTITVSNANRTPTANDDTNTTSENTSVSGSVTPNDVLSGDGGNTWNKLTNPAHGTVAFNPDGTYTYTPTAGYYGTDSFNYQICDIDNDCDPATVTITIQGDPRGLSKEVIDSNETSTTTPDVAIGEIVTYRVRVTVPPGVFTNARLVDTMDRGLSYMDCLGITSTDPGLQTSNIDGFSAVCMDAVVDNAGGTTTVDVARRVTFDFGTLTNSTGSDQTLEIVYRAVILDSAQNVSGVRLRNSAQWLWGSSGSLGPARTTLMVVEPDLSIVKTASTTVVSVGSEITITLTIQHTADSEVNAFDAVVTDDLPAELQYVAGSLECASGAQDADTCSEAGGTITAGWSNFALGGGNGRVTFRVVVLSMPAVNTASVAWTSLPGDVSAPQNINVFSTERGYDPGDSIDIYGTSSVLRLGASSGGGGASRKSSSSTLPATGFAPGKITDLGNIPQETYHAANDVTLEIPSLGIKLPVVGVPRKDGTWNVAWLDKQAGWLEGSAFPSWNGNSVLTGHVYLSNGLPGPFVNLSTLKYGDKIIIHAYGQKYTFEVRENLVVEPDDISILKHEEKPWVTLVTCKQYDEKTNTYHKRVAVRAVLISVTWE